jgi:hypothetical protein
MHYPSRERRLHVHHIDGNKQNNSIDNLIGLEPAFHEYVHSMPKLPSRLEIVEMYDAWRVRGVTIQRVKRSPRYFDSVKDKRRERMIKRQKDRATERKRQR